ncbi:MAG: hypothetical protein NC086_09155 [Alistipes sp.]|nr:hypothetical protein [Alistipes sp.]
MKKIITFLMSISLVFTLTACGNDNSGNGSVQNPSTQTDAANAPESVSTEAEGGTTAETTAEINPTGTTAGTISESEGGKTLVVYYSASGNTKTAADYIAAATNGDIFELVPVEAYSSADLNWTDNQSRVVYEHNNPQARDVALVEATVSGWDSYDTVFIGYPIWLAYHNLIQCTQT